MKLVDKLAKLGNHPLWSPTFLAWSITFLVIGAIWEWSVLTMVVLAFTGGFHLSCILTDRLVQSYRKLDEAQEYLLDFYRNAYEDYAALLGDIYKLGANAVRPNPITNNQGDTDNATR